MLRIVLFAVCLSGPCMADSLTWLFLPDGVQKDVQPSEVDIPSASIRQSPRDLASRFRSNSGPDDTSTPSNNPYDHLRLCPNDRLCLKGQYCDQHYGVCRDRVSSGQPCRRDEMCQRGHQCMFGHCQERVRKGHEGARCRNDEECHTDMCCARRHGHQVCQRSLQEYDKCYVPEGGLDYSMNQRCPCAEGLICRHVQGRRLSNRPLSTPPSTAATQQDPASFWTAVEGMRCTIHPKRLGALAELLIR